MITAYLEAWVPSMCLLSKSETCLLTCTVNGDAFNKTFNTPSQTMIGTIVSLFDSKRRILLPLIVSYSLMQEGSRCISRSGCNLLLRRVFGETEDHRHWCHDHDHRRLIAGHSIRSSAHACCEDRGWIRPGRHQFHGPSLPVRILAQGESRAV